MGSDFNINLSQADFGLKEECDWIAGSFLGIIHDIGFGAVMDRIHDGADVFLPYDIVHQTANSASTHVDGWHTNRGGYLQDRMTLLPKLDFTAGVRYDKDEL